MNVLTQLLTNKARCETRLANAAAREEQACHPFERQQAQIEKARAKKDLALVVKMIIQEECRQDEDELNYLDA